MRHRLDGTRVLIAEDDPSVRESLDVALRYCGCEVFTAKDGQTALDTADKIQPDLVLLDVMMPLHDGVTVCRALRRQGNEAAILMVTAMGDIDDRVDGLDAGADDYVVKPFSVEELIARCEALLRRTNEGERLRRGDLVLDRDRRDAHVGQRDLDLTRTEFDLLWLLAVANGEVVSRASLFADIWGDSLDASSRSLDVYVSYLRRKLEADGAPRRLLTERGAGFRLVAS